MEYEQIFLATLNPHKTLAVLPGVAWDFYCHTF
jgi:hypothetical protein